LAQNPSLLENPDFLTQMAISSEKSKINSLEDLKTRF